MTRPSGVRRRMPTLFSADPRYACANIVGEGRLEAASVQAALVLSWDGSPAPEGVGGRVALEFETLSLTLAWDLVLPGPVRVPSGPPAYMDSLWEWDVIELFLAAPDRLEGRPRYVELEIGAGGHWLALAFDDVRRRSSELRELAPTIESHVDGLRWTGTVRTYLRRLIPHAGEPPWRGLIAFGAGTPEQRLLLTSTPLPGTVADFHQPHAWGDLA